MFRVEGTARAEVLRACLVSKAQQGGQCAWNRVSRGRVHGDEVRDAGEAR